MPLANHDNHFRQVDKAGHSLVVNRCPDLFCFAAFLRQTRGGSWRLTASTLLLVLVAKSSHTRAATIFQPSSKLLKVHRGVADNLGIRTRELDAPPRQCKSQVRLEEFNLDAAWINEPHGATIRIAVHVRIVKLLPAVKLLRIDHNQEIGRFPIDVHMSFNVVGAEIPAFQNHRPARGKPRHKICADFSRIQDSETTRRTLPESSGSG
jgi:hypothetical protein